MNLNISLNGDINLRLFEVTAHCGLLLTGFTPLSGQLELYHQGSEILTFEGLENLIGLARELLASPGDCAAIANRGYARRSRSRGPDGAVLRYARRPSGARVLAVSSILGRRFPAGGCLRSSGRGCRP